MKIRNGFVSNSSSSSFVVVGIEFDLTQKDQNIFDEFGEDGDFLPLSNYVEKQGVCLRIASWDEEDEVQELSTNKIEQIESKIQKKYGTENKAKIYFGTQYN